MAIYRPIDEGAPGNTPKPTFQSKHEEDQYYLNMMNPQTGRRYDIPMLDSQAGDYYFKYIEFMKTKERSPETFDKILNWD